MSKRCSPVGSVKREHRPPAKSFFSTTARRSGCARVERRGQGEASAPRGRAGARRSEEVGQRTLDVEAGLGEPCRRAGAADACADDDDRRTRRHGCSVCCLLAEREREDGEDGEGGRARGKTRGANAARLASDRRPGSDAGSREPGALISRTSKKLGIVARSRGARTSKVTASDEPARAKRSLRARRSTRAGLFVCARLQLQRLVQSGSETMSTSQ